MSVASNNKTDVSTGFQDFRIPFYDCILEKCLFVTWKSHRCSLGSRGRCIALM